MTIHNSIDCNCKKCRDNNTQTNNYWYYQPPRYYGNR